MQNKDSPETTVFTMFCERRDQQTSTKYRFVLYPTAHLADGRVNVRFNHSHNIVYLHHLLRTRHSGTINIKNQLFIITIKLY